MVRYKSSSNIASRKNWRFRCCVKMNLFESCKNLIFHVTVRKIFFDFIHVEIEKYFSICYMKYKIFATFKKVHVDTASETSIFSWNCITTIFVSFHCSRQLYEFLLKVYLLIIRKHLATSFFFETSGYLMIDWRQQAVV